MDLETVDFENSEDLVLSPDPEIRAATHPTLAHGLIPSLEQSISITNFAPDRVQGSSGSVHRRTD